MAREMPYGGGLRPHREYSLSTEAIVDVQDATQAH